MAYTSESLENFISSNEFKMVLYIADTEEGFEEDEDWADLCEAMVRINSENDSQFTMDFQSRYMQPFKGVDRSNKDATTEAFQATLSLIKADLNDNYILAALTLKSLGLATNLRLIPEAAFNKHSYQGYKDEFAVVRLLAWAGYDINDADDNGMTALHYFSSLRYQPISNPRAVQWLIEHGAEVDAVNERGDTPLIYVSGNTTWNDHLSTSFSLLVNAGANPFAVANDGSSPYTLLSAANESHPHPGRTKLINTLDAFLAAIERMELEGAANDADNNDSHRRENLRL